MAQENQIEKPPMCEFVQNLLIDKGVPLQTTQTFYDANKVQKNVFSCLPQGEQSHLIRRRMILKAHPEVTQLLKHSKPYSMILCIMCIVLNFLIGYNDQQWWIIVLVAYIGGATLCHTLQLLVHDFTHFLGHSNVTVNKAFAIFCNFATGIPAAIAFMKYHADHHNFLGEQGYDPDMPTYFQARLAKKNGIFFRIIFLMLFPFIYALRPLIISPKRLLQAEIINMIVIICLDLLIIKYFGYTMLIYNLLSGIFSLSLHPAAGHTLAQHFQFAKGMETYDYFGFWNFFGINAGYHIEHHDFPTCPWYDLPTLRKMAPQFYENLPHHTSYLNVYRKFIFDPNFNLYNRTMRFRSQNLKIKQY